MTPDQIRRHRPSRFSEIVGAKNRRSIARLQRGLLGGGLASPQFLVGPYGYCKTSLARLLLRALDCDARDPITADPCLGCPQCRCSGPEYNGFGLPYRRIEVDCSQLGRDDVTSLCDEYRWNRDVVLFLDEFHHLRGEEEALLKFLEDFRGLILGAVMQDRIGELAPPLRERVQMTWLYPPTEVEITEYFAAKCAAEWKVDAPRELVRRMVLASNRSFRICQQILAAAAENEGRRLNSETIEEFLSLDGGDPSFRTSGANYF